MLQPVADEDVRFVKEKDASYGSSWKQRGGVGAFMMLARKWDRLENILSIWGEKNSGQSNYDIFAAVQTQNFSGADGMVLAEVRDLRRYLLLVEAELVARQKEIPTLDMISTGPIIAQSYIIADGPNTNGRLVPLDWTGLVVQFTPSAAGLAGEAAVMQGTVITDISDWLKIQCGPGLDSLYHEPKSICRIVDSVESVGQSMTRRIPRMACDNYTQGDEDNVCSECGFTKGSHPQHHHAPVEDSNRHARQYLDEKTRSHTAIGRKSLITKSLYDKCSPEVQSLYVVTGDHCQLDRRMIDPEVLRGSDLGRFSPTILQEDFRMYPDWTMEMYDARPDGYHLKDEFVPLWGKV
jgi:hypothetical protein